MELVYVYLDSVNNEHWQFVYWFVQFLMQHTSEIRANKHQSSFNVSNQMVVNGNIILKENKELKAFFLDMRGWLEKLYKFIYLSGNLVMQSFFAKSPI